MRMRQIIRGGHVEAGFIPEKRQRQQRSVRDENRDKDQRKDASERKFRQPVDRWLHQFLFGIILNLIDLALLRGHGGVKLDFAECAFILVHVLLQNIQQGLGLLRA